MKLKQMNALASCENLLKIHNVKVYEDIKSAFEKEDKAYISHATGLGKTYIALRILFDLAIQDKPKKVLYVSPTKVVRDYFFEVKENELHSRPELKALFQKNIDLQTCLYAGAGKNISKNYDYIILDEMHRLGAKVWGENVKKLLANNPKAKVLGMTATLERTDGQGIEYIKDFFGDKDPVSEVDLVQALQSRLLPSPKYIVAQICSLNTEGGWLDVNEAKLRKALEDEEISTIERAEINELLKQIYIAKKEIANKEDFSLAIKSQFAEYLKQGRDLRNGKFIVFCPVGKDEETLCDQAELSKMIGIMRSADDWFSEVDVSKISKDYIYSGRNDSENASALHKFKQNNSDGIKLLFAINMLNEGLHVGDIDGVIMLRNTSSRLIYLQQLGRVLSVSSARKKPLIFDLVDNVNTNMDVVINIARSINASPDNDLSISSIDIGEEYAQDFQLLFTQRVAFMHDLRKKVESFNRKNFFEFEDFFKRLVSFKAEYGHCKVPAMFKTADGYPLGQKVSSIRSGILNLTLEQEKRLDDIGFIWKIYSVTMQDIIDFLIANERIPRPKSEDEEERRIHNKYRLYMRYRKDKNRFDAEPTEEEWKMLAECKHPLVQKYRAELLERREQVAKYGEILQDTPITMQDIIDFLIANERIPGYGSEDEEERRIYRKYNLYMRYRKDKNRFEAEPTEEEWKMLAMCKHPLVQEYRAELLERREQVAKYGEILQDTITMQDIIDFLIANERIPRYGSEDEEERRIHNKYRLYMRYRKDKNRFDAEPTEEEWKMLAECKHPLVQKYRAELLERREQVAKYGEILQDTPITMQDIIDFLIANERIPRQKSEDEEERRIFNKYSLYMRYRKDKNRFEAEPTEEEWKMLAMCKHPLVQKYKNNLIVKRKERGVAVPNFVVDDEQSG